MGVADKQAVLASVKRNLAAAGEKPLAAPALDTPGESPWLAGEDPWEQADIALQGLGDRFYMVEDKAELEKMLKAVISQHEAACSGLFLPEGSPGEKIVSRILSDSGAAPLPMGPDRLAGKDNMARADLGVTLADALFQDTGSILQVTSPRTPRTASLLPPVHVVLIPATSRVASLDRLPEVLASLRQKAGGDAASAEIIISGHSRTADIELLIVSGVHGPGLIHALGLSPALTAELFPPD